MIQFKSNSTTGLVRSEEQKRESSSLVTTPTEQELGNPSPNSFDFRMPLNSDRVLEKTKVELDGSDDMPLFDSVIKPQLQ